MERQRLAGWVVGAVFALALGLMPALAAGGEEPAPAVTDPAVTDDVAVWQASPGVPVTGVSLAPTSLSLEVGARAALTAQVHPFNAANQTVTWSSSDESVARVDGRGMVTAVGEGQALVTVTTGDGGFTASCPVQVTRAGTPATVYPPVVKRTAGGTTTVFPSRPVEGSVVTISAVPDVGHEVAEMTAVDQAGRTVPVIRHLDGTWAFRQPDSQVTVSVTFRRIPWDDPFPDVGKGDWYYDSVALVCQEGLMEGTGQGFAPHGAVTRGTLATILARLDGADTTGGRTWYEKGMAWAVAEGVSDGTDPEGMITREQAVSMLYRYAGSPAVSGENVLSRFPDGGRVSAWAQRAMRWAVAGGLIQGGDRGLDPQGGTTRAELAAMLSRFLTMD